MTKRTLTEKIEALAAKIDKTESALERDLLAFERDGLAAERFELLPASIKIALRKQALDVCAKVAKARKKTGPREKTL